MPDVFGPFTTATWQQPQWMRDAPLREPGSGVFSATDTFPTPASGDLALTTSGLTSTLALGRAHVRGAGYERTGTPWSFTHPTNTNANPRIDRIVLRRDLSATPPTVLPTVLQGVPAVTPAPPALTQNEDGVWDEPLHSVVVPGSSGATITSTTDERRSATAKPGQVAYGRYAGASGTVVFTSPADGLENRITTAELNLAQQLVASRAYRIEMQGTLQPSAAAQLQLNLHGKAGAVTVANTHPVVATYRTLTTAGGSGARQSVLATGRFTPSASGLYSFAPFVVHAGLILLTDGRGLVDIAIDDIGPASAFPTLPVLT